MKLPRKLFRDWCCSASMDRSHSSTLIILSSARWMLPEKEHVGLSSTRFPISDIDVNGLYALRDLNAELEARGTTLIFAGRRTEFLIWLREIGLYRTEWDNRLFPTLTQALKAYHRETTRAELPPTRA